MGILTNPPPGRPFLNERTYLEKIAEHFFRPLLEYKPLEVSEADFLVELFHLDTRHIERYRAKQWFHMPGLYLEVPHAKFMGSGYRKVAPKSILLVRTDDTTPEQINVSYHGGQGDKEQVFELTSAQWRSIERYVTKIPDDERMPKKARPSSKKLKAA